MLAPYTQWPHESLRHHGSDAQGTSLLPSFLAAEYTVLAMAAKLAATKDSAKSSGCHHRQGDTGING